MITAEKVFRDIKASLIDISEQSQVRLATKDDIRWVCSGHSDMISPPSSDSLIINMTENKTPCPTRPAPEAPLDPEKSEPGDVPKDDTDDQGQPEHVEPFETLTSLKTICVVTCLILTQLMVSMDRFMVSTVCAIPPTDVTDKY